MLSNCSHFFFQDLQNQVDALLPRKPKSNNNDSMNNNNNNENINNNDNTNNNTEDNRKPKKRCTQKKLTNIYLK